MRHSLRRTPFFLIASGRISSLSPPRSRGAKDNPIIDIATVRYATILTKELVEILPSRAELSRDTAASPNGGD